VKEAPPQRGRRRTKYCGAPTSKGTKCRFVLYADGGRCPRHDPAAQRQRALELVEFEQKAKALAIEKAAAIAADLPRLLEAKRELVLLDDRIRTARRALDTLTTTAAELERWVKETEARATTTVDELLQRANVYLRAHSADMTPELCDLVLRCADAIATQARELRQTKFGTPIIDQINGARSVAERVAAYRRMT